MKFIKYFAIILTSLIACSCSSNNTYHNNDETVVISVEESNYYDVKSTNPKEVKRGSNVSFKIDFNDGYGFKESSAGYYENGFLKINNVQYSETIHINCAELINVSVATPSDCHYKITSANPLFVEKGQNAVFDIQFDEGYVFESSSAGYYKNGKLTLEKVENNIEVFVLAKLAGNIHIQIKYDEVVGLIKVNGVLTNSYYGDYGETITLEAIPLEERRFVCWSYNGYIKENMPYSFERVFNITLKEDVVLYANFWNHEDNTIVYYGNSGSTECGDEAIYYPHVKGNHVRINTIQGSNAFKKAGYLLDSWNTKQDGSGTRIGLGSRVKIPDIKEPLVLYAIWIKETNCDLFEFELLENSSYALTKCYSQDDTIVIPEFYNDLPITVIKKDSFNSLSFNTLYLSTKIKEVEEQTIKDCINFSDFHFFDSLDSIPNNFSLINPSKLYINANTDPCYAGSYQNAFVRKTDLLLECDSEKIVFIGNSNTMYSIDGSIISETFKKDVLCYGVQSGVGVAWELACLREYCRDENNTIVFCCEFGSDSVGSFTEHKYYAAEINYDLLLAIDFNELKFSNVYGGYSKYKELKKLATVTPYSKNDFGCDNYGCLKMKTEPYRSDDWCSSIVNVNFNFYKNGGFNWAENYCSKFTKSKVLISSCSFNKNCIDASLRETFYNEYQQSIIDYIQYPVISKLKDYAFTGTAFATDNYHLIYSYAVERTNKLISDLSGWL